jgi:hypothetical protein
VEFRLKIGKQGHVYLPKRLRETLGDQMKMLPNMKAAVIYPADADPADVVKSLRVIISDLELRVKVKEP